MFAIELFLIQDYCVFNGSVWMMVCVSIRSKVWVLFIGWYGTHINLSTLCFPPGLSQHVVSDYKQVVDLLDEGIANR